MIYRAAPGTPPLVTFLGGRLLALHSETGAALWEHRLDFIPSRVLVAGPSVFVASVGLEATLHRFELATGRHLGGLELGFRVTTALTRCDVAYFGGPTGLLALRADGTLLFSARGETVARNAWSGDTVDLVVRDPHGRELHRAAAVEITVADGLLVFADAAAQPDFDT